MRFALAVIVAALAQIYIFLQLPNWIGPSAMLAVFYLAFTAVGAGWFAAKRSALAGALSVVLGVVSYAVITFLGPAGTGMMALDLVLGVLSLVLAYWPYILIGAVGGAVGGSLRKRIVGAR